MNINTIIFDLGGVIIDLDFKKTPQAFSQLTNKPFDDIFPLYFKPGLFQDYEKGLISDAELRTGINKFMGANLTDQQIDEAWCAMLGQVPKARLEFMAELRSDFKVLVLSNTNAIHVRSFNETILKASGKPSLDDFADEVYFSHELKMRKPDAEIYEEVLRQSGCQAAECLFLDDTQANLDTAAQVGIKTLHIAHPDEIFNLKQHV